MEIVYGKDQDNTSGKAQHSVEIPFRKGTARSGFIKKYQDLLDERTLVMSWMGCVN